MNNRSMVATYTLAESTYNLSASGETLVITSNLVQIKPTTGTHTVSIREAISGITYVVNVNEVSPLLDSSQGIYCTKDIAETSVSLDITSYALNGYIDIGTDNLTSKIILHNTPSFSGGSAGVTSFNTRAGVVTLQASDVTSIWPKASAGSLGVVRVGTNLSIDGDGILSSVGGGEVDSVNSRTGAVTIQESDITNVWPKAAAGSLGVIRVGTGLAIDGDGILSNTITAAVNSVNTRTGAVVIQESDITAVWPEATKGTLGVINVGDGLSIDSTGVLTTSGLNDNLVQTSLYQTSGDIVVSTTNAYNTSDNHDMERLIVSGGIL